MASGMQHRVNDYSVLMVDMIVKRRKMSKEERCQYNTK